MSEVPEFFKEKVYKQYDEKSAERIIKGILDEKKVTLRANTIKANIEEIKNTLKEKKIAFQEVEWYQDAFIIQNVKEEDIRKIEQYEQGKIYLQSLSSMLPSLVLNPKENENILDMCAAPGGKTTQMYALSNGKAYITACEQNKIRAEKLKYNIKKQGAGAVSILIEDSRNLNDYLKFDKILLDAPCSGSGTNNIFKKNFTEELIRKNSKIQEKLLKKALNILKDGGELVYSTCSIFSEENESIIEEVLKNKKYKLEKISLNKEIPELPTKLSKTVTICPNELFEGFFIAKIKKEK